MKKILFFLLIICTTVNTFCNGSVVDSIIYNSKNSLFSAYNASDVEKLMLINAKLERAISIDENSWLAYYYMGLSNLYLYLITDDNTKKELLIQRGIRNTQDCININKNFADAYILQAYLYNLNIGLSPNNVIELYTKSNNAINRAKELESTNPRLYLTKGIIAFFTPEPYGGGNKIAKENLEKSQSLFMTYKTNSKLLPDWGYVDTYAWLGQVAERDGDFNKAEDYYQTGLKTCPGFGLIKNYLLPKLLDHALEIVPNSGEFSEGDSIVVEIRNANYKVFYTLNGADPNKNSKLYTKPIVLKTTSTLKAAIVYDHGSVSKISVGDFKITPPYPSDLKIKNTKKGLKYYYYEGEWNSLPDFAKLKPKKSGITDDFNLNVTNTKSNFGIFFVGYIDIPEDGSYKFYLSSDDGSSLYLDKRLILNNDGLHSNKIEKSHQINLKSGKHLITLKYFQKSEGKNLKVRITSGELDKTMLISDLLYFVE